MFGLPPISTKVRAAIRYTGTTKAITQLLKREKKVALYEGVESRV